MYSRRSALGLILIAAFVAAPFSSIHAADEQLPANSGDSISLEAETILLTLKEFRQTKQVDEKARLADLQNEYTAAKDPRQRLLVRLALGVYYAKRSPRLALQYLGEANELCRVEDPLSSVIKFYRAEARSELGAYASAITDLTDLLSKEMGPAWDKLTYAMLIEAYARTEQHDHVLSTYAKVMEAFGTTKRQTELMATAAKAMAKKGHTAKQMELWEDLAAQYPITESSRWAFGELKQQRELAVKDKTHGYVFPLSFLTRLAQNVAVDSGIEPFIREQLRGTVRDAAHVRRQLQPQEQVEQLVRMKLFEAALVEGTRFFAEGGKKYSASTNALIQFEMGRAQFYLGDAEEASRRFAASLEVLKDTYEGRRAREWLADSLMANGMYKASMEHYEWLAQHSGNKTFKWNQFWTTLKAGLHGAAMSLLDKGHTPERDYGDAVSLTYWRGKIAERLGDAAGAESIFREILRTSADSYYAASIITAYPKLREPSGLAPASGSPRTPGSLTLAAKILGRSGSGDPTLDQRSDLRAIQDMLRIGLQDAAVRQLGSVPWRDYRVGDGFAHFGRLAWLADDYRSSRGIAMNPLSPLRDRPTSWWELKEHQRQHTDDWKVYYPYAFRDLLSTVSTKVEIDPMLVLSIMRTESFYNPEAVSQVGARGLMQLMPQTAAKVATLMGDKDFDLADLGKPDLNIGYGAYYLKKLLRYYGDNPYAAIAAYNAGPQHVNRWVRACTNCTNDEFVEAIPFRETRRYVKEVVRAYSQYRYIHQAQDTLPDWPKLPAHLPAASEIF